jgi:hypothetical protein
MTKANKYLLTSSEIVKNSLVSPIEIFLPSEQFLLSWLKLLYSIFFSAQGTLFLMTLETGFSQQRGFDSTRFKVSLKNDESHYLSL